MTTTHTDTTPTDQDPLTAAILLTADDLARRWQVQKSQVYGLRRTGKLPAVQLGRYYRFRLADIEAFEAAGGTDQEAAK